jgi:phage regulator Rha-like protein
MTSEIVTLTSTTASMTSLEISILVEKRHDNVKALIDRLSGQCVITLPEFQEVPNDGPGPKTIKIYRFSGETGRRDSIIVVAQLSPEFTGRLVDRWQELEAKTAVPAVTDPIIAAHIRALVEVDQLKQRQLAVEVAQAAMQRQMDSNTRQLQQIETASDYFTIIGWWRYAKLGGSLPLADAARLGKEATAFCQAHEVLMGETPDPRFGHVRTYPKWVLDNLFAQEAA